MAQIDSIDKIVTSYFSVVTAEDFDYKDITYKKKDVVVRKEIFRGFTCPASCGACCSRFSLDYLPSEPHPYNLTERVVTFKGKPVTIYSDIQNDHEDYHCRNLNKDNGRCGVHGKHPFSCDFELIRSIKFTDPNRTDTLTTKLYGRAWAMKRIDDSRGAMCELLPPSKETIDEVIRKLNRLKMWCEHFQLKHRVDTIIDWARSPTQRVKDLHLPARSWAFSRM